MNDALPSFSRGWERLGLLISSPLQSRRSNEDKIMAKVKRSITINAPVEKVFGYWEEPTNRPEVWPSFVEVKDVQRL